MTVWVVIRGMWSDQQVEAVFSSADKAKAAYPDGQWEPGNCVDDGDPDWTSKAGLSDYHSITGYLIDESGGERQTRERETWLTQHPEFR